MRLQRLVFDPKGTPPAPTPQLAWLGRGGLWLLALLLFRPGIAQAQDAPACENAVAQAQTDYFEGRFDPAIQRLERCLSQNAFSEDQKEEAYTLLGRVYFAKGLEDRAAEMLRELLALVPSYRPSLSVETPDFVAFVDRVRLELEEEAAEEAEPPPEVMVEEQPAETVTEPETEPEVQIVQPPPPEPMPTAERTPPKQRKGITKWLLIGGGVVVAGVAAVLLTGGDPPPPPSGLPLPPA